MKRNILFSIVLLLPIISYGRVFTWTGSTDTVFVKTTNWSVTGSPGYPGSGDTAIISTTSPNRPVLAANQDVYYLNLGSSGAIDLKNYSFTVQGYADIRGTVNNGTLELRGQSVIIKSTAYVNSILDIEANYIQLDGGTYMKNCYIEMIGHYSCSGEGGCIFHDEVTIVSNTSSSALLKCQR